jgi:lipoic acid synthetase
MPGGPNYTNLKHIMRESVLHTVCEEARCPNIGECWERKTATFMILGDICTRACTYCAVTTGTPIGLDLEEPIRLAQTVESMNLQYVVITSVNRDDLPDGGSFIFSQCIKQIKKRLPKCKVEVLTPDFAGNYDSLSTVVKANPDTFNHNIETVRRVFPRIRAKGNYDLSLDVLKNVKQMSDTIVMKSGIMVGLGETMEEIIQTMKDLRTSHVDLLTVGQYLRPSQKHAPISKWYTPNEFKTIQTKGEQLGFKHVSSGPLVRSSYHADKQYKAASLNLA